MIPEAAQKRAIRFGRADAHIAQALFRHIPQFDSLAIATVRLDQPFQQSDGRVAVGAISDDGAALGAYGHGVDPCDDLTDAATLPGPRKTTVKKNLPLRDNNVIVT